MTLLAALVLTLASSFAGAPEDRQEDSVRSLIEQLSSDRIEAREQAYKKLEAIGRPALPLLEKAALDPDGEVSSRARTLIVRIPIREHLTPSLVSGVRGIYDRLALGEWREVFLELANDLRQGEERRQYPGVRADDLSFMAPMAVARAESEGDRVAVCQAVSRLKLKSAVPSVLPLLRDERFIVRANAVAVLRDTDAREQAEAVLPLLGDPHAIVRSCAAHTAGRLGLRAAIPRLIRLLRDDSRDVRWWAVHALGELKAVEALPEVEKLRGDIDETVARVATQTAESLSGKR
jgi:HEAT repeat protein